MRVIHGYIKIETPKEMRVPRPINTKPQQGVLEFLFSGTKKLKAIHCKIPPIRPASWAKSVASSKVSEVPMQSIGSLVWPMTARRN